LEFQDSPGHEHKVLPDGIHEMTEEEFHNRFCMAFPSSKTRPVIDARYAKFRKGLASIISSRHWVDGSFVEDKINPNDVDIVVWVDSGQYNALSEDRRGMLDRIFDVEKRQVERKVHAHLEPSRQFDDAQYAYYRLKCDYWRKWYGTVKTTGDSKGIVSLSFGTPNKPAPIVPDPWGNEND